MDKKVWADSSNLFHVATKQKAAGLITRTHTHIHSLFGCMRVRVASIWNAKWERDWVYRNRNRSRNRIWWLVCLQRLSLVKSTHTHAHTHRYYWKNSHFVCRHTRHVVNMWGGRSCCCCCCISFTCIVAKHDVLHIRVTFAAAGQGARGPGREGSRECKQKCYMQQRVSLLNRSRRRGSSRPALLNRLQCSFWLG